MNEIRQAVLGIDSTKEILDVWYELYFLKAILTKLIAKDPGLVAIINDEFWKESRVYAKIQMGKKFPNINIKYEDEKESNDKKFD